MSRKTKRLSLSMLSLALLSSGFITSCNKGGDDNSSSSTSTTTTSSTTTTLSQWEVTQEEFATALKEYESNKVPSESRDVKVLYESKSKTATSATKGTLILKGKLINAISEENGENDVVEPTNADYSVGNIYSKVDTEYAVKKDTSLATVNQVIGTVFSSIFSSEDYSKFTYNSTDKAYTASSITVNLDLSSLGIDTSLYPTASSSSLGIPIEKAVLKFDTKKLVSSSFKLGEPIATLAGMSEVSTTVSYGNNTVSIPTSYNENKIHKTYYASALSDVSKAFVNNKNIKFKITTDDDTTSTFTVDGDKWLVEETDKKYFVKDDVDSNQLLYIQGSGATTWTQITDDTEYRNNISHLTELYEAARGVTFFIEYYSSLTYDEETKSYKADELTVETNGTTYKNLDFKFNCSNIVSLTYVIPNILTRAAADVISYTVSEIDVTTQTVTDPTVVSI